MHRTTFVRLAFLLVCLLALAACERRQHRVEQHLLAFGTLFQITLITTDLNRAQQLLTEIELRLDRWNDQWHAWEDSDLTRFNAALARGATVEIPPSLQPLLELSRQYYDASGGLFDPALGRLIGARGFHGGPPRPGEARVLTADPPDLQDLLVDGRNARSLDPRLQLDFGGIAKGYALGLIRDYLDENGIEHYLVNAGGDLVIAGNRRGKPWRIGIQNPYAPGAIASVELEGRHSLFTSGNYRRYYRQGERRVHHILDPRSGKSATGHSSATILTQDPVRADVAATVFVIAGSRDLATLADALRIDRFLLVSDSRQIEVSRAWVGKVQIIVPWDTKIIN